MGEDTEIRRFYDQPEEDRRRLAEILARIENLAQGAQLQATWRTQLTRMKDRVQSTDPPPTKEERLALYQAVREAEVIPEEASFFLIAYTIEWIAEDRLMAEFHRRLAEAEKTGSSDEIRKVNHELEADRENIIAQTYLEFREGEMADLFLKNRQEFERIREDGRRYFASGGEKIPI